MRAILWALFSVCLFGTSIHAQSSTTTSTSASTSATASAGVNVANVPDCAKTCLSNSTQYATDCAQIDVKCLCNSQTYVSALSCCLATNCSATDQQTAIQFNLQECTAVNSTAPNFVGCSPFSLTTGGSSSKTASSTSTASAVVSTISGGLATIPTAYTNTAIGTASFTGNSLLTGSCTVPMFAKVTQDSGMIIEFPQVGCALNRGNCCPYDPSQYLGVTRCPADYVTTSGACCPNGYSVYSTLIGAETPCYSQVATTYVPASSVTGSQITLITDSVFSRSYVLVQASKPELSGGVIAAIVVNALLFAAAPFILVWLIRRRKAKQAAQKASLGNTFPPQDPDFGAHQMSEVAGTPAPLSPHELASPEANVNTPATLKGMPIPAAGSSAQYSVPSEMPGSTYMHEHHPVYTSQTNLNASPQDLISPSTPTRSLSGSRTTGTGSPVLSPSSSFRSDNPSNLNSFTVTPLGSPGPLTSHSTPTRFREGTM